ncbi:MAG: flagellar biosynthesis protein FlhF [Phycisphaerales bacterium]|nr:flagellar biosynthesis protein FlhF [Phycisphaerales bacterium]
MTLKTYRAQSIADALGQIKKDLGKDAVILHTRQVKVGGILGFGARTVVEITASAGVNVAPALLARRQDSRVAERAPRAVAVETPADVPPPRAFAAARDAYSAASTPAQTTAAAPAPLRSAAAALATPVVMDPVDGKAVAALSEELAAIKAMVARALSAPGGPPPALMPEALTRMYLRLLEAEVASQIADEIISDVRDRLGAAALADDAAVQRAVTERLAAYIPAADAADAPTRAPDGRPFTIALVGPTGVGKTTTIAKLAATYKLRHGRKVGLVTADTYRIAAVDQLRTYANIIGLPLQVALTPAEMGSACAALRDCDIVLVDTAGRSPKDAARLTELKAVLDAARPHEVHLALSSAASESCLIAAAQKFAEVGPDRVIFTKLDEAVNFGTLVNVARRIDARLSFVTTGQEVPDKIERGSAERIARLVVEGGLRA